MITCNGWSLDVFFSLVFLLRHSSCIIVLVFALVSVCRKLCREVVNICGDARCGTVHVSVVFFVFFFFFFKNFSIFLWMPIVCFVLRHWTCLVIRMAHLYQFQLPLLPWLKSMAVATNLGIAFQIWYLQGSKSGDSNGNLWHGDTYSQMSDLLSLVSGGYYFWACVN